MLRSGPANDTANPATEQTTATAITAVKPRSGCCNSQPTIAGHAAPSMPTVVSNTAGSPPLHVVGCLAVEKAQQASVQRGERQAGQNLADQNGRVAVQE